jgi:hypothetical protein
MSKLLFVNKILQFKQKYLSCMLRFLRYFAAVYSKSVTANFVIKAASPCRPQVFLSYVYPYIHVFVGLQDVQKIAPVNALRQSLRRGENVP